MSISDSHNLIRYVGPNKISSKTRKINSSIFVFSSQDLKVMPPYLSCFWFEFRCRDINKIRNDAKNIGLIVNKNGLYVEISISKMKRIIKKFESCVTVDVKQINKNNSHSGIYPTPFEDFRSEKLHRDLLESVLPNTYTTY